MVEISSWGLENGTKGERQNLANDHDYFRELDQWLRSHVGDKKKAPEMRE